MKATRFIKHLAMASLILMGNVSVFANHPDTDFVYNTEEEGGIKVSEIVYKMEKGFLTNYKKYNYKYNEERQITENVLQRWDAEHKTWNNDMCIRYNYDGKSVTVSYYKWSNDRKEFVLLPRLTSVINN